MVDATDVAALRCEERLEFWEAEAMGAPVTSTVIKWEAAIGDWMADGDVATARAQLAPVVVPARAPAMPAVVPARAPAMPVIKAVAPSPAPSSGTPHSAKRRSPDDVAPEPKRAKPADDGLRAEGVNADVDPLLLKNANWAEIMAGIAALLEFMMRAKKEEEVSTRPLPLEAFEDSVSAEPDLATIRSFLRDMAKICRYTPECNVIAFILLIRFFAYQPSLKLTDKTWRRYLLTALMISQKYWDDRCLRNIDFMVAWRCALPGQTLDLRAVNDMEKFFLSGIGYDLYIQPDKYAACLAEVRSIVRSARPAAPG